MPLLRVIKIRASSGYKQNRLPACVTGLVIQLPPSECTSGPNNFFYEHILILAVSYFSSLFTHSKHFLKWKTLKKSVGRESCARFNLKCCVQFVTVNMCCSKIVLYLLLMPPAHVLLKRKRSLFSCLFLLVIIPGEFRIHLFKLE